jgi:hypothetical protein
MLIARKDPRRHPRVAARWLLRYLEECEEATIDEAAMAAACLATLAGRPPPGRGADTSGHGRKSAYAKADASGSVNFGPGPGRRPRCSARRSANPQSEHARLDRRGTSRSA